VGKKSEPIVADIVLSFSVLILLYGLFNIVEWKYTMKPGETEGSLVALISSFFNSFVQGIITFEPFSMFVIGTIALVVSALSVFNLNEAGLNNFTVDDSSQGMRQRLILWAVVILIMVVLFSSSISFEKPHLITEKQVMVDEVLVTQELSWGLWKFEEGTSQTVGSVFIALWIGLTLYTAAQIAEIVRGSIQALPRGQIEAAISLGLSPYQRLKLVILPQALRSMIPSMTNQYLNCWKNSSLAFVVGFSDFYAVFTTIVNNAGQAVPVFIMILFTYQAGSLVISAIMNYINSSVTKVKI
jgi:ABC-type amino acid transport system permease subunit